MDTGKVATNTRTMPSQTDTPTHLHIEWRAEGKEVHFPIPYLGSNSLTTSSTSSSLSDSKLAVATHLVPPVPL